MGWGTNYTYEGYLNRISIHEIPSKVEELEKINKMLENRLYAYAAATPPPYYEDEEGNRSPYIETLEIEIRDIIDTLKENYQLLARIEDCEEAMKENPESVKDE